MVIVLKHIVYLNSLHQPCLGTCSIVAAMLRFFYSETITNNFKICTDNYYDDSYSSNEKMSLLTPPSLMMMMKKKKKQTQV